MGVDGGYTWRGKAQDGVGLSVVEDVDKHVGALEVSGLKHHRDSAAGESRQRTGGIDELVFVVDNGSEQHGCFGKVGGDDATVRDELVAKGGDGFSLEERVAGSGHHDGVDHDVAHCREFAQGGEHGADEA